MTAGDAFRAVEAEGAAADAETAAALTLATWFSPGYPVGAYAWSHGLEAAIAAGEVADADAAERWIGDCLRHGAGRSDAVLLVHARRGGDLEALDALARALNPARERRLETLSQGAAFAEITAAAWGEPAEGVGRPRAYPVAVGAAARAHALPEGLTLAHYLHAFAANLVSAAVRRVPLGQRAGQIALARLQPVVREVAAAARALNLDQLGGCALGAEIAALRHETQKVRLFRS